MKKLLVTILSLFFLLTGCSAESSIRKTTDNFYKALESGDISAASQYLNDDETDTLKESVSSLEEVKKEFKDADTEKSVVSEIDDLEKQIVSTTWQSHTINSIKTKSDTSATVSVTVKGVNAEDMATAISSIDYNSFYDEVADDTQKVMNEKGEKEAEKYLYGKMASFLKDKVTDALKDTKAKNQKYTLILEKKNAGWIITDISEKE